MIIQPNNFRTCFDCNCNYGSCKPPYLAKPSDYFSAELTTLTGFMSVDQIVNGDFATDFTADSTWVQSNLGDTDWTYDAGLEMAKITLAASVESELLYQLINYDKAIITFWHSQIFANSSLEVYGKIGTVIATYTGPMAAGTETIILNADSYNRIGFKWISGAWGEVSKSLYIDDVTLIEMDITSFEITNCCDDTVVDNLDKDDIILYSDHAEIYFRWSKYASIGDQYKLCFDKQIIENGTFTTDITDWDQKDQPTVLLNDAWVWAGGEAASTMLNGNTAIMYQSIYLEKDCPTTITLTITGDDDGDNEFFIYTDDESLNESELVSNDTPIDLSYTFYPEYTGFQNINFYVNTILSGGDITFTVDDVSIIMNVCSPCYDIAEHDCSLLIEATNDQDSYGLSEDFTGVMRIEGQLYKVKPEMRENVYRDSMGNFSNPMTDFAFITELSTYLLHKDQILGVLLLLSFDNLRINKSYYVKKEGNPEINWDEKHEFGSFKIELYEKEQYLEKVY